MATEVGEVVVDSEGNVTGHGLAFLVFTETITNAGIPEEASKATAATVGPWCEGLARVIGGLTDEVDASTSPLLAESHACTLEVSPGGVDIFTGAYHSTQGIAWVEVDGVANLFISIRTTGSAYQADERCRIVRFIYADDGSTITHEEFSEELQIGHGQSLSAVADGSNVTLYCSVYSGAEPGVSVQKGFTRITWNGASTSQSDVEDIIVLPDDDAGEPMSRYFRVHPGVSTDQKRLVFLVDDGDRADTVKSTILVYDFAAIIAEYESSGDATAIQPLAIIRRPQMTPEGHVAQGIGATSKYIYLTTGYYQPYGDKRVVVIDFAGNIVRVISVACALNNYTLDELRDHATYGVPAQFELEGIAFTDEGALLTVSNEKWLDTGGAPPAPIVTFDGANYACIVDALGNDESPRNDRFWVPTDKAANSGTWSSSTSYSVAAAVTRRAKEVWSIHAAGDVGTTGEYQINANAYVEASNARVPGARTTVDFSCPPSEYFSFCEYSPNTLENLYRVRITQNGLEAYDTRADASNDEYGVLALKANEGRHYFYLRAADGALSGGAGINIYADDDSEQQNAVRMFPGADSTIYFDVIEDGVRLTHDDPTIFFSSDDLTIAKGDPTTNVARVVFASNQYRLYDSRATSDNTKYATVALTTETATTREYMYLRSVGGALTYGAGLNLYGGNDSVSPWIARLYADGSNYLDVSTTAVYESGGLTLGDASNPWPDVFMSQAQLDGSTPDVYLRDSGNLYINDGTPGSSVLRAASTQNQWRIYDSRSSSTNGVYATVAITTDTAASREYMYLRSVGGSLSSGAGINLYGGNDSVSPWQINFWADGSNAAVISTTAFYQSGGLTLGQSGNTWPDAYIDELRLTSYTVAGAPSASGKAGAVIYVSNGDSGSPCLAVSDGSNWKRIALGATIST